MSEQARAICPHIAADPSHTSCVLPDREHGHVEWCSYCAVANVEAAIAAGMRAGQIAYDMDFSRCSHAVSDWKRKTLHDGHCVMCYAATFAGLVTAWTLSRVHELQADRHRAGELRNVLRFLKRRLGVPSLFHVTADTATFTKQ